MRYSFDGGVHRSHVNRKRLKNLYKIYEDKIIESMKRIFWGTKTKIF